MNAPARDPRLIVTRYCDDFPGQLKKLVDLLQKTAASKGQERMEALQSLHDEMHRMAGTAHTMGFCFVGGSFTKFEDELEKMLELSPEEVETQLQRMGRQLGALARLKRHMKPENSKLLTRTNVKPLMGAKNQAANTEKARVLNAQRIICADDDPSIRDLLRDILIDLGVGEVLIVNSGLQALENLHSFKPTIVMTDWRMEPINGLSLLRLIRTGETVLPMTAKVIFLTAQKNVKNVRMAVRQGVDHFLTKPFTRDHVERSILSVAMRDGKNDDPRNADLSEESPDEDDDGSTVVL